MTNEFNLIPYIADILSTDSYFYDTIDDIYYRNEYLYVQILKQSESKESFGGGSIIHDSYYRKSIAILEDIVSPGHKLEKCEENLIHKIEKRYNYSYVYVKNHKEIDINDFHIKLAKKYRTKNLSDDKFNSYVYMLLFLAINNHKPLVQNESLIEFIQISLVLRDKERINKINTSVLQDKDELNLKKFLLELKAKYPKIKYTNMSFNVSDIVINDGKLQLNDMEKHEINSILLEYIYDCENINLDKVCDYKTIEDKDILLLLRIYYMTYETFDDVIAWLPSAIQIMCLLKAYNKAKDFIKKNDNEKILLLNRDLMDENEKLKTKLSLLQQEYEKLLDKSKNDTKKIDKLEHEIESFNRSKYELIELRNMVFRLNNEDVYSTEKTMDDMLGELNQKDNIIVIGGHPGWVEKMKNILNWDFISTDKLNVDINIFRNNICIVNTDNLSHAMYYKMTQYCNKYYLISGSSNIDISIKKIYESLFNKE